PAQKLVTRLDDTLGAISGMLNTLLDINQIDAGTVGVELADLRITDLFDRLRDEFSYHAQAQELALHVVPCSLSIVQRLAKLLGHRVTVRSQLGKGSMFAIEVALPPTARAPARNRQPVAT